MKKSVGAVLVAASMFAASCDHVERPESEDPGAGNVHGEAPSAFAGLRRRLAALWGAATASQPPAISAERGLDDPVVAGAPEAQAEAAVAGGGDGFLVVWSDRRSLEDAEIWGARFTPEGTLVDPVGFPIARGPGSRTSPAVAFDGENFVVAWLEAGRRPVAIKVSQDAAVDGAPVALSDDTAVASKLALALTASRAVVVWTDGTYGREGLYASFLDRELTPVRRALRVVSGAVSTPTLACLASRCLAGAQLGSETALTLLDPEAETSIPSEALAERPGGASELALAASGEGYLGAYVETAGALSPAKVVVARIAAGGTLAQEPVTLSQGPVAQPAIGFDGTTVLVAWRSSEAVTGADLRARRLNAALAPVDAQPLAVADAPGSQAAVAVAAGTGVFLATWEDRRDLGLPDIYAARISAADGLLDSGGRRISESASSQSRPAVAFDGTQYLVVWQESGRVATPGSRVYGARVTTGGTPLVPTIALGNATAHAANPTVSASAGGWLVLWEDSEPGLTPVVSARWVDAEGVPADPRFWLPFEGPQSEPAAAGGESGHLVAWEERGAILGMRLQAGELPGSSPVLNLCVPGTSRCHAPSVVAGEGGWLVLWETFPASGPGGTFGIGGAFVPASGEPVRVAISSGGVPRGSPVGSFDGKDYLVVWAEASGVGSVLRGQRVSASGALVDPNSVDVVAGRPDAFSPTIAFDGSRPLLVFQDGVSEALVGAASTLRGGAVETFALSTPPLHEREPALACDRLGACLVAYSRTDPSWGGTSRVFTRVVSRPAPGQRCTQASECASGFCVDGVCCSSGCGGSDPTDCQACALSAGAPADGTCAPVAAGVLCREAAGACDAAESCDGAQVSCPADAPAADGAACDDGDLCSVGDGCVAGACLPGPRLDCPAAACGLGSCDPATGTCTYAPAPNGSGCSDGNACTLGDECWYGECIPQDSVSCTSGPCDLAWCNPATGACARKARPDGYACSDADACTLHDRCHAGACVSGIPAVCVQPDDPCRVASCDEAEGCVTVTVSDGTSCSDGDACTIGDRCVAGQCLSEGTVVCAPADGCHLAGACDPATGACTSPVAAEGTPCDDGDLCTQGERCSAAGACGGGRPVSCEPADACHVAGICDPRTGECSRPPAPDGTRCDDGSACTQSDACRSGACVGEAPVLCPPADGCHLEGSCDPATGACLPVVAPDGAACPGGACIGGRCEPRTEQGCGCGTSAPAGLFALLPLLALLARRRSAGAGPVRVSRRPAG